MDAFLLLGTAMLLGFRHGFDWDHIAALIDISGTAGTDSAERKEALLLSLLYAIGHASVVVILGIAAIAFAAILPAWIDSIMERVVGVTLLILGCYLFYAVFSAAKNSTELKLKSRWMLLISGVKKLFGKLSNKPAPTESAKLTAWTAFSIGTLHGLGAETGTQVLLIAAVGGANTHGLSVAMLMAFVAGLISSNTLVALIATGTFRSSKNLRPLYLVTGTTAGAFSLVVGSMFLAGRADALPDLQQLKFLS